MKDQRIEGFNFVKNNLDLIRLFAATQVVFVHAVSHLKLHELDFIKHLGFLPGVPIFFFISGFLIYRSYLKSASIFGYFQKRFLRIYPALWLCFFVSLAVLFGTNFLSFSILGESHFWIWCLGQLSFVQFYNPDFLRGFGVGVVNGSLWTIAVELQFYVAVPILFWVVNKYKKSWLFLIPLFFLINVFKNMLPTNNLLFDLFSISFLPWFGMFLWGAYLSTSEHWLKKIVNIPWFILIGLFLLVNVGLGRVGLGVTGNNINMISFLVLSLLIIKVAYSKPDLSDKVLKGNDISYGVYIYHMLIVNIFVYYGFNSESYLLIAVLLLTYACAILSWFLLEKPVLAFKKNSMRSKL